MEDLRHELASLRLLVSGAISSLNSQYLGIEAMLNEMPERGRDHEMVMKENGILNGQLSILQPIFNKLVENNSIK